MSKDSNTNKKANRLINASSPYLLQHAYNPVDWFPWGNEALQKARKEDKPIIVSIGYSACHWCHVMERESFENEDIAALMNDYFICIKVDREERPDVDAIYMDAVQLMGMNGGWPLNAFLTPDAKPFYAGTYFPPKNWSQLMIHIAKIFRENREEIEQSAGQFQDSIAQSELKKYGLLEEDKEFQLEDLNTMFDKLIPYFDTVRGGMQKAPKFPMPCLYAFIMQYSQTSQSEERKVKALEQVILTLEEMAKGGIYDQIGGGFARYSVDGDWFAPHFEKMLYDNAQLITLYTDAYNLTKNEEFKTIVYECIAFIKREMTDTEGGFYSALDADSEGVEGKFYIWEYEEVSKILDNKADLKLFIDYYNLSKEGNWEHGQNILHRKKSDSEIAKQHKLSIEELQSKISFFKKIFLEERSKKIRPGLDDKILTSWNGLMLKALCDAYRVFDEADFLELALKNAFFIKNKVSEKSPQGIKLYHNYKNGKASIDAYLEDYATLIEAYLSLYQTNFDFEWLKEAKTLMKYAMENFYDETEGMFFFTDKHSEKLIARKKEIFDNVIPSSNSIMVKNLFFLGKILDRQDYIQLSERMLGQIKRILIQNVEYLANWGQFYCFRVQSTVEIAILGKDCFNMRKEFDKKYFPNKVLIGSVQETDEMALLEDKSAINDKTTIFVCYDKACRQPVNTVKEAWKQIMQK